MSGLDSNFLGSIFRKDLPMVIATNRGSAVLLPVRLRYKAGGYVAGQVLARNTVDGRFQDYDSGGASGTDTASCILLQSVHESSFDAENSQGSTTAVGIFGGCTVYKDKLIDLDSDAETDLGAKEIVDASGVTLLKF
jgi:hypothetical protein